MSGSFKDLTVYKKAFSLAMEIFEITKKFPVEEKYELTDQIRRSSRAVCRGNRGRIPETPISQTFFQQNE
jgi:hypothetical protein